MKNQLPKDVKSYFVSTYGEDTAVRILQKGNVRFAKLTDENQNAAKEAKKLMKTDLFPCIALYFAMQDCGLAKEEAFDFLDKTWSKRAEKDAKMMQSVSKVFGLYKKMPMIFQAVAKKSFGVKAGFQATYYDLGKHHMKFDMTKCLYCDTCRKYGCPELTPVFCHTDDVKDGHVHPKLVWGRTKTMGDGADCCDFELYVKKEK